MFVLSTDLRAGARARYFYDGPFFYDQYSKKVRFLRFFGDFCDDVFLDYYSQLRPLALSVFWMILRFVQQSK